MPFNTLSDYYNPLDAAVKVQQISALRNTQRLNAMKMKEGLQAQQAEETYQRGLKALGNPNIPMMNALNPTPPKQPPNMPPNAPGMRPNGPNLPSGGPLGQTPTAQPQMPEKTPEQQKIEQGQQAFQKIYPKAKEAIEQSINDPNIAKKVDFHNKQLQDPSVQAFLEKQGFYDSEIGSDPDKKTTYFRTTRNFTPEDIVKAINSGNPGVEMLRPFSNSGGTLRIDFDPSNNYAVRGVQEAQIQPKANVKYSGDALLAYDLAKEAKGGKEPTAEDVYGQLSRVKGMEAKAQGERYEILLNRPLDVFDVEKGRTVKMGGLEASKEPDKYRSNQDPEVKAYNEVTKRQQLIATFTNRIDRNSDIVLNLAGKVNKMNPRLANVPINRLRSVLGSGDLQALELALTSLSNEIAKVESGSLGVAGASVEQMAIMRKIHDPNLNLADMTKVINTGKLLGKTSLDAIQDQRKDMLAIMQGKEPEERKPTKNVVETRTAPNGKKIVKYSDGSLAYAE